MKNSIPARVLSSVLFLATVGSLIGCSSVPRSKGYDQFSSITANAHDFARSSQRKLHKGRYAKADAITEHLGASLAETSCYKILSSTIQFGLLEPEVVFKAESKDGGQALVVVPPVLEDKERFPTPQEANGIQVFRIDEDAPFGGKMVRMLESMVGRSDLCVTFNRLPKSEDRDMPVIGVTALPMSAYAVAAAQRASSSDSESASENSARTPAAPSGAKASETK